MGAFRRHLQKAASDKDAPYLRYWWNGKDAPVGGYSWVDRVSGRSISLNGGSGAEMWTGDSYAMSAKRHGTIYGDIDLGRHFRIVIDADIEFSGAEATQGATLLDFMSLRLTDHALACIIYQTRRKPDMNYKMFGNVNNVDYHFPDGSLPEAAAQSMSGVMEFGNEMLDEERDILYFRYNGGEKVCSKSSHPAIRHDGFATGSNTSCYVGYAACGAAHDNVRYVQDTRIREIRIYVYD